MKATKDIKYILYARKSTESEDRQVQSIEAQVEVMTKLAEQRGLRVVKVLKESKSAKTPFVRAEFTKMLGMIEQGQADGILCWQISRLSRNPYESGALQQLLQDEKIQSIQTHDRAYLSDDNAVIFSVEASISNQFIRDLRKNVKRGIREKARNGGISGIAPEGYVNNRLDKTIEPDPVRFPLIRKAFNLLLTGEYSVQQILRIMNEDWGYTTIKRKHIGGGPINRSSIYHIFGNPRYAGQVPDPYEEGKFYKANYKPMITMAEYDQVQRILGKKGRPRFSASKQFALRGFIKCGDCGCMVTAETKSKQLANGESRHYTYYHCTGRGKKKCNQRGAVREEDLFAQLNELIDSYDLSPKLYEWGMQALNEMAQNEVAERNDVQVMQFQSVTRVQEKLDKLLDLVTDGHITTEEYQAKSDPLKSQLKETQAEQIDIANRIKNWYEFVGETLDKLTCANEKFMLGDLGDKKEILLAIGKNPVLLDKRLVLTTNTWLNPIKNEARSIRRQLDKVRTAPEQIKKDLELTLFQSWYPRTDSNRRPSVPKTDALIR